MQLLKAVLSTFEQPDLSNSAAQCGLAASPPERTHAEPAAQHGIAVDRFAREIVPFLT